MHPADCCMKSSLNQPTQPNLRWWHINHLQLLHPPRSWHRNTRVLMTLWDTWDFTATVALHIDQAHVCVLVQWLAGCCRSHWFWVWWRRWRCCRAGRAQGLASHGWISACPGSLFWHCSDPGEHKWQQTCWSGCLRPLAHPSAAPPHSPPHAAHGDQAEATGLGTVATLHV